MTSPIITYSSIVSGDAQKPLGSSVLPSQHGSNSAMFDGPANTSSALLNRPPNPSLKELFQSGFQPAPVRSGTPPLPPKPRSPSRQAKMPYKDFNQDSSPKMPTDKPLPEKHRFTKHKDKNMLFLPFLSTLKSMKNHHQKFLDSRNNIGSKPVQAKSTLPNSLQPFATLSHRRRSLKNIQQHSWLKRSKNSIKT